MATYVFRQSRTLSCKLELGYVMLRVIGEHDPRKLPLARKPSIHFVHLFDPALLVASVKGSQAESPLTRTRDGTVHESAQQCLGHGLRISEYNF